MLSKMLVIFCAVLLFAQCNLTAGFKDYKDYKIYSVMAQNAEQQQLLQQLSKQRSYDFLTLSRQFKVSNKVLLSPAKAPDFVEILSQQGIVHKLLVDDVSVLVAKERAANAKRTRAEGRLNVFESFYRHGEINAYLDELAAAFPTRVFIKTFGYSHERRPLKIITISNGDARAGKKVIFIDAAMHAREWITPSMALHIISELVENYDAHAELLQDYDWVILPVVNADGYEYTHTDDRFWRKTRQPSIKSTDPECYGTDPNRNFDFAWTMEDGASWDPCDETFRGDRPFSEPEAQVVRDIMLNYKERAKMYLSLHSYGNLILLPWGHTAELPDNYFDMMDVADAGAIAMVQATGAIYTYGNTYAVIYPTSGDSADYAAGVVDIPVTLAMELPAGGFEGFDPSERQIEDIVKETWIGIRAMAEVVVKNY